MRHQGQRCWMGMLDGELEETYFKFINTGCTNGEGPLEQTETRYAEGPRVRNLAPKEGEGVTECCLFHEVVNLCHLNKI
jgi:hypothetical protein